MGAKPHKKQALGYGLGMSKITDDLSNALEVAAARYQAAGVTIANQADETREVLKATIEAVYALDARLDALAGTHHIGD